MKRPPMLDALKGSIAAESTARAGRFDDLDERVRRADKIMGTQPPPVSTPEPAPAGRKRKAKRVRLTRRDSFNLPTEDHALLESLVQRAMEMGAWTTKSSVVRAGIHALVALGDDQLRAALMGAHPLKPGRKPAQPEDRT